MKRKLTCIFVLILFSVLSFYYYNPNYNPVKSDEGDSVQLKSSGPTSSWIHDPGIVPKDIAISNDGSYIVVGVSGGFDGRVYLYHKSSSTPLWDYDVGGGLFDVDISGDGNYIVACGDDDYIHLFNRTSSTPIWSYTTGTNNFMSCAISDDGYWIAGGHYDGDVYMFNITDSRPMWSYHYLSEINAIDMAADGSVFVVKRGAQSLSIFNRSNKIPLRGFSLSANTREFELSDDGKWLSVTDYNNRLRLFNTSKSLYVWQNTENVWWNSISGDGKYIVAADPADIYFYNRTSSKYMWTCNITPFVYKIKISADGKRVAVGTGTSIQTDGVYYFNSTGSVPEWFSAQGITLTREMDISYNGSYIAIGDGENDGAAQVILLYQDIAPPLWDPTPSNQVSELGADFSYDVNATDPSGINRYWINDTTDFEIDVDGTITNKSYLAAGDYWIEVRAYDNENNYCNATIKIIVKFDITPPTWDTDPSNQFNEFGSNFSYDVDASDTFGIANYWINDITNFNIDLNGVITNKTLLSERVYGIEIRAYDPSDNYCSAFINITVADTTAPSWITDPVDQINEFGSDFSYDVDAIDPSGIHSYWINDTAQFNINSNGLITNISSLDVGVYWIEIGVNDTKNFILNAIINITIEDTTPPEWSSSLVDQVVDYGKNSSYSVDAWDLSGIASFWINDTIHFDIDSTGLITNISSLRIGVYWIEIRAYDPYNNYCSAIIKLTVKDPAQQPDVGDIDYTTIIIIISIIGIPLIISIIIIVKKRK